MSMLESLSLVGGLYSLSETFGSESTANLIVSSCSCYGMYKASETLDADQSTTLATVSSTAATMLSGCSDSSYNDVQDTISYVEKMSDEDLSNLIAQLEERQTTLENESKTLIKY